MNLQKGVIYYYSTIQHKKFKLTEPIRKINYLNYQIIENYFLKLMSKLIIKFSQKEYS